MCRAAISVLANMPRNTDAYACAASSGFDGVFFLSTVQYFRVHPHSVTWVKLPENDDNDLEHEKNIIYDIIITVSVGRSTCRVRVYILAELNFKTC